MWCELIMKNHQNEETIWMKTFLSDETNAAKNAWSSYHAGKKSVPTPTLLNSSILLLLLKDVVHTSDYII